MIKKLVLCVLVIHSIINQASAANPCYGHNEMLNIVDRPNNADSACTVPAGKVEFELGYQNQTLREPGVRQQNFPSGELRLGLAHDNEIYINLPNYIQQSAFPTAGFTQTSGGLKHQLWYNQDLLFTVEGSVNLPDGSAAFGNKHAGGAFNGIISYNVNSRLNLTLMAGGSSTSEARQNGGQRFYSLNPDFVATLVLNDKTNLYGEVFGQSKTGYGEGSGFNVDAGILYLIQPRVVLDASISQRLSGYPNGFERYVGAGISVMM